MTKEIIQKEFDKRDARKRRNEKIEKIGEKLKDCLGYIVVVVLFPIWFLVTVYYQIKTVICKSTYNTMVWSDDVTEKYLDKILPHLIFDLVKDSSVILFSDAIVDNLGGISFYRFNNLDYLPKKYKRHKKTLRYIRKFKTSVKEYITLHYQIEGYKKTVLCNEDDWMWAQEKFGWDEDSMPSDYSWRKGVLFYEEEEELNDVQ